MAQMHGNVANVLSTLTVVAVRCCCQSLEQLHGWVCCVYAQVVVLGTLEVGRQLVECRPQLLVELWALRNPPHLHSVQQRKKATAV